MNGVTADVVFSQERGFFDSPFEVALATERETATIYYTLDGSIPTADDTVYSAPIAVDGTTTLRAIAIEEMFVVSEVGTQTYLFVADVLQQSTEPEGFPDRWGAAGRSDYAMDQRVVSDMESEFYDPHVADALTALPTISIVMDGDDFFGTNGIQSNPTRHGDQWERASSVEFIDFDDAPDGQFNSGIRMVGNASRSVNRAKHNMRLAFRDDYGDSSLEYPVYGEDGAQVFEDLILRGQNGDSWVNPGVADRAQYIRDQWQRAVHVAMGYETSGQMHAHVYVNGLYWGLYHVLERFDASFMALHFGGSDDEYDTLKEQDGNRDGLDAISGTTERWDEMIAISQSNIDPDEKFHQISEYVDMASMIDYLLINFYHGNNDWDHRNFRAGASREDGKFQFFTWDAERSDINALNVSQGQIGPSNRNVSILNNGNRLTGINTQLRSSEEYRMLFADHVQRHFFDDGLLSESGAARVWNDIADEIRLPLSAEAARWGDRHRASRPRTVETWESILTIMNEDFFPVRTDLVLNQFRQRGVYPDTVAPILSRRSGDFTSPFDLEISADDGVIYYTLDGSDPREIGGEIANTAVRYTQPIVIDAESAIKVRVLNDGEWSALVEATYSEQAAAADVNSIRISEIHFHPADSTQLEMEAGFNNANDFEFIELLNVSDRTIDLTNVRLQRVDNEGVDFAFANSTVQRLQAGESVVVVEDAAAFAFRYSADINVAGQWSGGLSNSTEAPNFGGRRADGAADAIFGCVVCPRGWIWKFA